MLKNKKVAWKKSAKQSLFAPADEVRDNARHLAYAWTPESGLTLEGSYPYPVPREDPDLGGLVLLHGDPLADARLRALEALSKRDPRLGGISEKVKDLQERFEKFNNGITTHPSRWKPTSADIAKTCLAGMGPVVGLAAVAGGTLMGAEALSRKGRGSTAAALLAAPVVLGGAGLMVASVLYSRRLFRRAASARMQASKEYKEAFIEGVKAPETDYAFIRDVYTGQVDPTIANVAKARGMLNAASYNDKGFGDQVKSLTVDAVKKNRLDSALKAAKPVLNGVISSFEHEDNLFASMDDSGYLEYNG